MRFVMLVCLFSCKCFASYPVIHCKRLGLFTLGVSTHDNNNNMFAEAVTEAAVLLPECKMNKTKERYTGDLTASTLHNISPK